MHKKKNSPPAQGRDITIKLSRFLKRTRRSHIFHIVQLFLIKHNLISTVYLAEVIGDSSCKETLAAIARCKKNLQLESFSTPLWIQQKKLELFDTITLSLKDKEILNIAHEQNYLAVVQSLVFTNVIDVKTMKKIEKGYKRPYRMLYTSPSNDSTNSTLKYGDTFLKFFLQVQIYLFDTK